MNVSNIPLPENWPDLARQVMVYAVLLAHFDIICAWRRVAYVDKLQTERPPLSFA